MSIRVCHPFGNPNSFNAAISFLECGALTRFHTLLYGAASLRRREHPELPSDFVSKHPARETLRLAATLLPPGPWHGRKPEFVDWVARGFDACTARRLDQGDKAVYCFEDSADETFKRAADLGVTKIYELPTPYYREKWSLFEKQSEEHAGIREFWTRMQEPKQKLERKERELMEADIIVVASNFVRDSVVRHLKPLGRFVVVPYGSDVKVPAKQWTLQDESGPLRLFYAGVLGPAKGLHILFDALASLPDESYHLTLAGRWQHGFQEWLSSRFPISYEWLGQIPHSRIYEACRRSHLFVFPSLADGFGLVMLEAMASGIPVIASNQSAGPEIICNATDGWVVQAGDVEELRRTIECALNHRKRLPEMGAAARHKAESLSWERYREELRSGLSGAVQGLLQ